MGNVGIPPGETFRMVPDRLWTHPTITPFAVRLWCCLWFLSRDRGETDASDATIASELHCTIRTVQRGLTNLEDAQFLTRHQMGRDRLLKLHPEGDKQPIEQFMLRIVAG